LTNVSAFSALVSVNLHDFALDVDDHLALVSEELAPFTVGCADINLVAVEVQ
jgi:hypothetical protein